MTPGVALSASQIANLTSDMVWLVEKEVKLPDGTTQKALVPTVYLAQGNRLKLSDSGALIAADKVDIRLTGTLTNSGSIAGGSALGSADTAGLGVSGASTYVAANNIINQAGGSISSNGLTNLNAATDLVNQGGSISGQKVLAYAGRDLKNEAATSEVSASYNDPGHSWSGSSTVVEKGSIAATGDIQLGSGRDLSLKGAQVTASSGNVSVSAGGTLDVGTTQAQSQGSDRSSNSAAYDHNDTVQVTSSIQGKAITLASQNDMKLQGAQVAASDTLNVAAGGDLQIAAAKNVKTSAVRNNHNGSDYKEDNYDETVVGSQLQAKNNVSLQANGQNGKGNLSIVGSSVGSENGELNLSATKAITLGAETERHESHRELHNSGGGFFSSSSSDEVDHTLSILAKGSVLSGDRVTATAGSDLTVRGSQVVATKDTKLQAVQGDVNLVAAQQTFAEEHERHTESSGIFSSGAGITIGSQSTKLNTDSKTLANVGSTIGSLQGNVTIGAGNNVNGQAATVISGKDTVIQGKDIKLVGAVDTQDDHLRYEESKSGLTLSLGGAAGDALTSAYSNINAASGVQDGRLKALYDYRAAKDLSKLNDPAKLKDVGLSVSIGSSRMLSDTTTHSERVNSGSVQAGGDVRITASRDLTIGTPITGTNVTLAAQTGNLNVEAGQEKGSVNSHNESSSWAVGGTINSGYFGSFSQGSGKENGTTVTNVPTIVTARDKASLASGNDTNIVGSNVAGKSVTVQTGGNLNLVSLQDTDNYNASNEGFSLSGSTGVKSPGGSASYNTGTTNSNYASVTKQAGIYAGKDGFDIQVGKNTDLKGAVIASDATPDKNKLSTGTLTYSDIENKAEYNASSVGIGFGFGHGPLKDDKGNVVKDSEGNLVNNPQNSSSYTPGISVNGSAGSTTQSAIAPGTITITGNQTQDISKLNRDTNGALNALGKIFDKKTVQERQELANLFGQEAFNLVGDISARAYKQAVKDNNKQAMQDWSEGGINKILLHSIVGGIMSDLSGNGFTTGAASAALNEAVQKELAKIKDAGLRELVSSAVGAAAAKIVAGNASVGASVAASATTHNALAHHIVEQMQIELANAQTNEQKQAIIDRYLGLSNQTPDELVADGEYYSTADVNQFIFNYAIANNLQLPDTVPGTNYIRVINQGQIQDIYYGNIVAGPGGYYDNSSGTDVYVGIGYQTGNPNVANNVTTPPTAHEVIQDLASSPVNPVASTAANIYLGVDNLEQGKYGDAALNGIAVVGGVSIIRGAVGGAGKIGQAVEAGSTEGANVIQVPGRVQSRINLRTGSVSEGAGWEHVVDRHFNPAKNASQFTVTQDELRTILQSDGVVNSPVIGTLDSADGVRYVREVTLDRAIGVDKFSGQSTSTMTVLTDEFGNLVTATPGVIK